jgi:DNA-binding transcriptional LysR family regulator
MRFVLKPRHRHLDLNLLIALQALLRERSVSGAAKILSVSQPVMSRMLRDLRVHFEDPLLERVGRRYRRTFKAEALTEPLQCALDSVLRVLECKSPDQ